MHIQVDLDLVILEPTLLVLSNQSIVLNTENKLLPIPYGSILFGFPVQ